VPTQRVEVELELDVVVHRWSWSFVMTRSCSRN
jgi:hypothetical protein